MTMNNDLPCLSFLQGPFDSALVGLTALTDSDYCMQIQGLGVIRRQVGLPPKLSRFSRTLGLFFVTAVQLLANTDLKKSS